MTKKKKAKKAPTAKATKKAVKRLQKKAKPPPKNKDAAKAKKKGEEKKKKEKKPPAPKGPKPPNWRLKENDKVKFSAEDPFFESRASLAANSTSLPFVSSVVHSKLLFNAIENNDQVRTLIVQHRTII